MSDDKPPSGEGPSSNGECSVCVAVHIRPLIGSEIVDGCQHCTFVDKDEQQVAIGTHTFRYDYVFGSAGLAPASLYPTCVLPLVDALFKGYNATVFAYGQTGSGKTYTMGSAFQPGGQPHGVIPSVMETIFSRVQDKPDTQFFIRVGFVEIHKEEIRDLLHLESDHIRPAITVRETPGGGVCLAGATEVECQSLHSMAELLYKGSLCRSTASTQMNNHSSRSHAIFTITLEQRVMMAGVGGMALDDSHDEDGEGEGEEEEDGADGMDDYLCAKMHLVDLAGSERAKRTKAEGQRLQEAIQINKGLLALGNVISSLVEKRTHVPYRNSKLTRLLQDSLGGNSRTVMLACVSPADSNMEESVNTLRYAANARKIRNKPVVNRDPMAARVAALQQQLAAARAEVTVLRKALALRDDPAAAGKGGAEKPSALLGGDDLLSQALIRAQEESAEMHAALVQVKQQLVLAQEELQDANAHRVQAETERARMQLKLAQLREPSGAEPQPGAGGQEAADGDGTASSGTPRSADSDAEDVLQAQAQRIADLEREVDRLNRIQRLSGAYMSSTAAHLRSPAPPATALAREPAVAAALGTSGRARTPTAGPPADVVASPLLLEADASDDDGLDDGAISSLHLQQQQHELEQGRLSGMMQVVDKTLEQREAQLHRMVRSGGQAAVLKQHYDRVLKELQQERDQLQRERTKLLRKFEDLRAHRSEDREALEAKYRAKLERMEERVAALKKREREFMRLERLKSKAEQSVQQLQAEIARLRQQKVSLSKRAVEQQKDFEEWKKQHSRDLALARKEGRRTQAEVMRLQALQAKQQAVLRRKTQEAELARKKLQDMVAKNAGRAKPRPGAADGSSTPAAAASAADASAAAPRPPGLQPLDLAALEAAAAAGAQEEAPVSPETKTMLSTEAECRSWVEEELERCNQSWQLRRVLDGELAQRSEAAHQLHEANRRLGSLYAQRDQGATPDAAAVEKLEKRREHLGGQIGVHSESIAKLQQDIEAAKEREANEAAAASKHHADRWSRICSPSQSALLFGTLFQAAASYKAQSNEALQELVELRDELEMMRMHMDATREEAETARRQAMEAHQITAFVMAGDAALLPGSLPAGVTPEQPPATTALQDSQEAELEGLLTAMEDAIRRSDPLLPHANGALPTPSGSRYSSAEDALPAEEPSGQDLAAAAAPGMPPKHSLGLAAESEGLAAIPPLAAPFRSDEPELPGGGGRAMSPMQPMLPAAAADAGGTAGGAASLGVPFAAHEQLPEARLGAGQRESSGRQSPRLAPQLPAEEAGSNPPSRTRSGTSTPPSSGMAIGVSLSSHQLDFAGLLDRSEDGTSPSASRPASPQPGRSLHGGGGIGEAAPTGQGSQEVAWTSVASSSGQGRGLGAAAAGEQWHLERQLEAEMYERPVLRAVNMERHESNQAAVLHLTDAILQQHLKGKQIHGIQWRAGQKTREEMIEDFRLWLGLPAGGPAPSSGSTTNLPPPSPRPSDTASSPARSLSGASSRDGGGSERAGARAPRVRSARAASRSSSQVVIEGSLDNDTAADDACTRPRGEGPARGRAAPAGWRRTLFGSARSPSAAAGRSGDAEPRSPIHSRSSSFKPGR